MRHIFPGCPVVNCTNSADPRMYIHGPDGRAVNVCDAHGYCSAPDAPCICPPVKETVSVGALWRPADALQKGL